MLLRTRTVARSFTVTVLAFALVAGLQSPSTAAPRSTLKVMTQNLYVGASLEHVIASSSLEELIQRATAAWATARATDFPERAQAIADEIVAFQPHVVALQEAALWTTRPLTDPPQDPTVRYDFVQILLDALADRGASYEVVASVDNFGGEVPAIDPTSPSGLQLVGLIDRDALLVRSDLPPQVLDTTNAMSGNFDAGLSFVGPLGPVEAPRGWVSADVTLNGMTTRVIGTHLERVDPTVQQAQAQELLDGPAATTMPVVLLGDFNSAAGAGGVPGESDTPTYGKLLDAGFVDTWSAGRSDPGFSCCQAEDLLNRVSALSERIDLVLVRGARPLVVQELGDQQADRTPTGLWPSDHAGMSAAISTTRG